MLKEMTERTKKFLEQDKPKLEIPVFGNIKVNASKLAKLIYGEKSGRKDSL